MTEREAGMISIDKKKPGNQDDKESYDEHIELESDLKQAVKSTGSHAGEDEEHAPVEKEAVLSEKDKKKQAAKINHQKIVEILEAEVERLLQEMEAANFADLENNKSGKPALNKLQIIDNVQVKLRNQTFAKIFLDKGGLDHLYQFLKKLPDGSLPLSSVRKCIFEILMDLPYEEQHLKGSKIGRQATEAGKILSSLYNNLRELPENKKKIELIKEKWNRVNNHLTFQYGDLETAEKDNKSLNQRKRKRTLASNFAEKQDDHLADNTYSLAKVKMGYNFTVRPASTLTKRELSKLQPKKTDIDKHLTKMRKLMKN